MKDFKLNVLRTIDKFDKIGSTGVKSLLTKGMKDSSGAYLPGLNLLSFIADDIISYLNTHELEEMQESLNFLTLKYKIINKIIQPIIENKTVFSRLEFLAYITDTYTESGYKKDKLYSVVISDFCIEKSFNMAYVFDFIIDESNFIENKTLNNEQLFQLLSRYESEIHE